MTSQFDLETILPGMIKAASVMLPAGSAAVTINISVAVDLPGPIDPRASVALRGEIKKEMGKEPEFILAAPRVTLGLTGQE